MMDETIIDYLQVEQTSCVGKTVLVGVSGGPDSVALLHFFHTHKKRWDMNIIAITVNHQLRGQAALDDVTYVRDLCHQWNIPLAIVAVDVHSYQKTNDMGVQVAARELRYAAFAEKMQQYDAHFLALGHHGDDQIETMLFNFMRTADVMSLSGIPFSRPFATGKIIRPLLCVTKEDIWRYCERNSLEPRIDQSNDDESYTRNYIRKQIVPKMKQYNPNLYETLNHLQYTLELDEQFLQKEANAAYAVSVTKKEIGYMLNLQKYYLYEPAIQRRIFRLLMKELYQDKVTDLSYIHERQWQKLAHENGQNQRIHFPQGMILERSYEYVYIYNQKDDIPLKICEQIQYIPHKLTLPNGHTLTVSETSASKVESKYVYYVREKDIVLPLTVRTRRAGDRMTYRGLNGTKKIKDILMDEKIPNMKRDSIWIIEDGEGKIIWLVGLKKSFTQLEKNERAICLQLDTNGSEEELSCTKI